MTPTPSPPNQTFLQLSAWLAPSPHSGCPNATPQRSPPMSLPVLMRMHPLTLCMFHDPLPGGSFSLERTCPSFGLLVIPNAT